VTGHLIAFEGLDQSGKQTQAARLRDYLTGQGRVCRSLSFPDYDTPIGAEIFKALHGDRDYAPDVMQLLYVANRGEKRARIEDWIASGDVVICDRYVASSIAYGEAHGLDSEWLTEIQRFLPVPSLTIFLDIAPQTAVGRKAAGRDRFERDLDLLARVRASYRRQSAGPDWVCIEGERAMSAVAADVTRAAESRLGLPSAR
jgi:dTMP kinase